MAQRMIHYAIAKKVIEKGLIIDKERFIIGSLIPDSHNHNKEERKKTHFMLIENNRKTYDFDTFFEKYKKEILNDDLYLGYYIHLVTDAVYRVFLYHKKGLNQKRKEPDFINKIYHDYHALNKIIIKEYELEKIKIDVSQIPNEWNLTTLDNLENEISSDFQDQLQEPFNYFSYELLKEVMDFIIDVVVKEVENVRKNKRSGLDINDYWYES